MNASTIIQPCWMNGTYIPSFAPWAIVDFDWSESRNLWSSTRPYMNCEETMLAQARALHELNPAGTTWIYRNSIKALPWFTSVREKLQDRAFWGWFLPYKNCTNYECGPNATHNLYHDFEQTPNARGDGCGEGVECGEYLFDLRNASLRAWMQGPYLTSPVGLGSGFIKGFFFDDSWSAAGPSEESADAVNATGLTKSDVADMVAAGAANRDGMVATVIAGGGFVWQYFLGGGAQAAPGRDQSNPRANCTGWLRANCGPDAPFLNASNALVFGFTRINHTHPFPMPAFEQDLATFLLTRGPYAWLGSGWIGCDREYPYPPELAADYGEPAGVCRETAPGIFEREWTKASVKMDCPNWQGTITMK